TGITFKPESKVHMPCEPCILGKMTRGPFQPSTTSTTRPGECVFSDIKGPFRAAGLNRDYRYYVTYIDHFTRYTELFLLKRKSDQLDAFKAYEARMLTLHKHSVSCVEQLQTDNAGEYLSNACQAYYREKGIHHRTIIAYDSESNGLPERLNRAIMEIAEPMRVRANLSQEYWPFFVMAAVYLLNRRPHSSLPNRMTPFEAKYHKKPDLAHLRVLGCDAWVLTPTATRQNLDPHAKRAIFVGYATSQKAYQLWDPIHQRLLVSRDVIFNESGFSFWRDTNKEHDLDQRHYLPDEYITVPSPNDNAPVDRNDRNLDDTDDHIASSHELTDINQDCDSDETNCHDSLSKLPSQQELPVAPEDIDDSVPPPVLRYPQRERHTPGEWWKCSQAQYVNTKPGDQFFDDTIAHVKYNAYNATTHESLPHDDLPRPPLNDVQASDVKVPSSLREALNSPYGGYWSDAAHQEFRTLINFKTWQLRELPHGRKAIQCKWVFAIKPKDDGTIDKFKARLVIKGFSQRPGIDFDETFAPVAHQESMRLLLALAAQHGYHLRH